ncbi:MAG: WD40 repeat domain-containing protein [Phycisphaerae bacterium]|nr:WD40 repeat domain-containing protein [Phycisphaerae bacterium]
MIIRATTFSIVIMVGFYGCGSRDDSKKAHKPVTRPLRVLGARGRIATVGDYLVVYSSPFPETVYLCNWNSLDKIAKKVSLDSPFKATFMCNERVVFNFGEQRGIFIKDVTSGKQVQKFPVSVEWYCNRLFTNRSGTHVAVALKEDPTVTKNFDHPRTRIGLIGPKADKISWITTLVGRFIGEFSIDMAMPSDDGAYIGVGGWGNRWMVMIDVAKKKILWDSKKNLPNADLHALCFTSDNKVVYTADMPECIVYGIDVLTGKVLSEWAIPEESGFRIVSVAVSPDGRYVAVGTGPCGDVHVFSTKSGKEVMWIKHAPIATVYGLAFSSDSSMLATSTGMVRIWELPKK